MTQVWLVQVPPRCGSVKIGGRRVVKPTLIDPEAELRPHPVYVSAFDVRAQEPGSNLVEFTITASGPFRI